MRFDELKGLSREEIEKKTRELELELMKSRAQSKRGTVSKNPHQVAGIRRMLARIVTITSASTVKPAPSKPAQSAKSTQKTRTTRGGLKNE